MLSQVRDTLKGVVAWFFVILLILAFAMFGVPEIQTMTRGAAVSVGDDSYSSQYVESEFTRQMNIRRQESGGSFTHEQAIASGMPDQVISSLATMSALRQFAGSMGLASPRAVVSDFLKSDDRFTNPVSGEFDRSVLEAILRNNSMSVTEFENRIGDELLRNQLVNALAASGPAPEPMSEAMLLRETERRRIAYLIVTNEMAGVPAEPTPDDLETYYNENPTRFTAPEYRTFEYVELNEAFFRKDLIAPEDELRRLYDANKERLYDIPERRTLYQITLDSEAEANAAAAAVRQGKPFETIATENGLTLAAVTFTEISQKDVLDPSVGEAAFSSEIGEGDVIDPVKSLFGWTVAQVAGITAAESQSYDEVRDEIERTYLNADTRRKLLDAIDEIEEARDTGVSLIDAVADTGFEVKKFGPVDRYGFTTDRNLNVGEISPAAIAEAYKLEEGDESEALELGDDKGYFFVALDEITPSALTPFENVRDRVEEDWRKQERDTRISNTVKSIRDAVASGETLEEAASTFNRTPVVELIDRRNSHDVITDSLRDQVFFAELNQLVSGPAPGRTSQVIAQIREIGYGRSTISAQETDAYERYLGLQLDQELLDAFINAIREDYGVKINRAQLDSLYTEIQ